MKKLRAHYIWGIFATMQFREFCLPAGYLKAKVLKRIKL